MYYNPETKKTASKEEIMVLFNASFPDTTEEINGWHLVDESILYPALEANQIAVQEGIELHEGRYARTYSVKDAPAPASSSVPMDDSLEAKYARLEQAFLELSQMVSNLEDYRMLYEREREGLVEEQPATEEIQ